MMTGFNTIFLDTPFFIYLLEDHPVFGAKAALLLDDGQKKGIRFVTSVITRMEFCVKPYEANQTVVIDHFLNLLNDLDIIQ